MVLAVVEQEEGLAVLVVLAVLAVLLAVDVLVEVVAGGGHLDVRHLGLALLPHPIVRAIPSAASAARVHEVGELAPWLAGARPAPVLHEAHVADVRRLDPGVRPQVVHVEHAAQQRDELRAVAASDAAARAALQGRWERPLPSEPPDGRMWRCRHKRRRRALSTFLGCERLACS